MKAYLALLLFIFGNSGIATSTSFYEYCVQENKGSEVTRTVNAILDYYNTVDCSEPQKAISSGNTDLVLSSKLIRDLRPIVGLKGVRNMDLTLNRISDLSSLKHYKGLVELRLTGNMVQDISPLSTIDSLEYLLLYDNHVESIEALGSLKKLKLLNIQLNPIKSFAPLNNIKALKSISAGWFYDFLMDTKCPETVLTNTGLAESIRNLPNLDQIDVSGFGFADLNFLPKEADIESLNVSCNKIKNLDHLANFPRISTLNLSGNTVGDIGVLDKLPNLVNLGISRTGISSLKPLSNHPELLNLNISANMVADLSPLAGNLQLQEIVARNNRIQDLGPIAKLPSLLRLRVGNNPIKTLPDMGSLAGLYILELQNTQIDSLAPLKELKNLDYLNLENIGKLTASDLANLSDTGVRVLGLENNNLSDLSGVSIPSVVMLWLNNNNFDSIRKLGDFTSLLSLYMGDNPINNIAGICDELASLIVLEIDSTSITHIEPLLACSELSSLNLSNNTIYDIEKISNLQSIDDLTINGNGLESIDFIRPLSLNRLSFSSNSVESLEPLRDQENLRYLNAQKNQILSLLPLSGLKNLVDNSNFDVSGNPLGTSVEKTKVNCPVDALSAAVAKWCAEKQVEERHLTQ